MKIGRKGSSAGKATGGFTISRNASSGAFTHITIPGRGEVGVVSAEGFKAAKEAAGFEIKSARKRTLPSTVLKESR